MLVLFIVELWAFMATTTETSVILDTNSDTQLRINFNITLMDLSCDYASVDVYVVATPPYPTPPHRTAPHGAWLVASTADRVGAVPLMPLRHLRYDVLGTNTQNLTKNVEKWQLDENGVKRIFQVGGLGFKISISPVRSPPPMSPLSPPPSPPPSPPSPPLPPGPQQGAEGDLA